MMQIIDEDYIKGTLALPDGTNRITEWIHSLIEQRDTAELIAKACVNQIKPLQKRVDGLLEANNVLVLGKRDLRINLDAQIDAMVAELDEHRRAVTHHDFLEVAGTPEEALQLLEWFNKRTDLDLSWDAVEGDLSECAWRVHQSQGGHNDREWKLVCYHTNAVEALRLAHKVFCDGK